MESKNNLAEINGVDDFPLEISEAADQSAVADFIEKSNTLEELVFALKIYFALTDEYFEKQEKLVAVSKSLSEVQKERLKYTDKFIENGGTLTELLKDPKFLAFVEKEKQEIQ